jgi:hypothetical protein
MAPLIFTFCHRFFAFWPRARPPACPYILTTAQIKYEVIKIIYMYLTFKLKIVINYIKEIRKIWKIYKKWGFLPGSTNVYVYMWQFTLKILRS